MRYEIDEPTTLSLDFGDHPAAPTRRFDRLDIAVAARLEQVGDGTVCWRRTPADPVVIEATLDDERLSIRRPRAVELQLDAGDPAVPGTYQFEAALEYEGSRHVWPQEPREIEFVNSV